MLRHLEIRNYALIEHLEIDFSNGFSVMTGETGAGKSIIMGALSLVLGQRADAKSIQEGYTKCVVETTFDLSFYHLEEFFEEADIDFEKQCIIRREVHANSKSRAFINDTPVTLQQLKSLTEKLIDIHSQHESLLLSESSFQLDIVDSVAATKSELAHYQEVYKQFKDTKKAYEELSAKAEQWKSERDYDQFQFNQLNEAGLSENEQTELETELDLLNHTEEVKTELSAIVTYLDGDETGIQPQLTKALQAVNRIDKFLPAETHAHDRIESALIDLKDLTKELSEKLYDTDFNPERKQFVEDRLNTIYTLQQKHHVATIAELLELYHNLEEKLLQIEAFDNELGELQKQIDKLLQQLNEAADQLTQKRKNVLTFIEQELIDKLTSLGISNARILVELTPTENFLPSGKDHVDFLFAANKNATPQPIANVASGGEMSRLMLSIKSLLINTSGLPTIIFDEIDTGVSGEIAHKMGEIMRQISNNTQVIAITHLPQIAAKGTAHYKVFKQDNEKTTQTHIVLLKPQERLLEIAEMLSGKNPSQAAIDNAAELIKNSKQ
ncbi:MAG TPA: DNA repair protein RecN [Paludibacteraceae bacterium]|jgi:DNA repair protein RecN (Recombination protein N)|nr:MAG: DNA repair protein RecN [Bacteroidetes bacterium ADurb.Bin057]HOA46683.1 DNA repair protein RecN [Paludibacteraceae bacterium]HQC03925.1 DNA repair protein RecN [Paludibacteraceae bacterium]